MATENYKGLVLSAGGARGFIQLGALQKFHERGLLDSITHFSGSSIGAFIVFLIAIGYTPDEILAATCDPEIAKQFSNINIMNLTHIMGFFPQSILRNKLTELTMLKIGMLPTFKELYEKMNKFLIIPVYCLSESAERRKQFWSPINTPDMSIIETIILACNIPIIFGKATYEDKIYIDSAFTDTFPINALRETLATEEDKILGIKISWKEENLSSLTGYIIELLSIPIKCHTHEYSPYDDILDLQDPPNSNVSMLGFGAPAAHKILLFTHGFSRAAAFLQTMDRLQALKDEYANIL